MKLVKSISKSCRNNSFIVSCSIFISLLFLIVLTPSIGYAEETKPLAKIDIQSYVSDMQPGWNLGNTFDSVGEDETAWGNPPVTKELIEQIAAQGYKSIRIPITFDQRMANGPSYKIDEDFINRVDTVVNWALDEDLYVMINIHHDSWIWLESGMKNNHDESLGRFVSIWTQLADHFKDHSTKLMFESINEPRFSGEEAEEFAYLKELNTSFFNIVRNSGGNNDIRPLVLPTLDTGSEQHKLNELYQTIKELNDPYLISTVHYYGFWPFSVNIAGYTRYDLETETDIINTFDRVHETFVANGIPVILGEYGLLGFDTHTGVIQQGEKLKYFEFMTHYAQEKKITHMLWDNGQHFGRESFVWSDPQLYTMMKTSWETRSATAEANFIYLKKNEEITDKTISIDLHGNQFISLLLNDKKLVKGKDYEWDGAKLTFKASLLTSIVQSGEIGTNAVLTAKFNRGADWQFNVITYEKPVVTNSTGTTTDFRIPTVFNGDSLATMEAVYSDGSFAGPQNWTSFKEFGYAFSPDYKANEIILPERFFNEVQDGEVLLTLHFWSGETLSYTLLKEGNQVTGIYDDKPESPDDKEEVPVIEEDQVKENNPPNNDNGATINDEESKTTDDLIGDETSNPLEETPTSNEKPITQIKANNNVQPISDVKNTDMNGSNEEGNFLPSTATSHYNFLAIGFFLLLIGGFIFLLTKRQPKLYK